MNFGTYNQKNHCYEMVNATRSDFTFEIMVAEQDDLIVIPELVTNFTCQCMHGLART